jgi:hypothetical protein
VIATVLKGVCSVVVVGVKEEHEHTLEYRTVPGQGLAYVGTDGLWTAIPPCSSKARVTLVSLLVTGLQVGPHP